MGSSSKNLRFLYWGCIFIWILMLGGGFSAQNVGHIQIKCEPGVNIYLNGNFCNQTTEEVNGLIIQDVPTGRHTIKAIKNGCQPIEQEIDLSPGQVQMIELTSFIPKIETYEEGMQSETRVSIQTGKIIIQSLPLECSINIPSLDIFGLKKNKDKRILDKVPAGTYQIEFIGMGKTLNYTIQLKGNDTISLMVNFIRNEITMEGGSGGSSGYSQPVQTPQETPAMVQQATPVSTPQPISISPTPNLPQGNILFSDTFTGEERTRPASWTVLHAPEREYWYIFDQQYCTGNGDNITGKNGYSWAVVNAPGSEAWTNYSIQTSLWVRQANGRAIILGRYKDGENFYAGVFEAYQGDRYLRIHKVINGTWSILASLKNTENGMTVPEMEDGISKADSQIMTFTLDGSRLILSLGDSAKVEAVDGTFNQGTCGLGEWYQFILFDDFTVNAIGASVPDTTSPPGLGQQTQPVSNQWNPLPAPSSY